VNGLLKEAKCTRNVPELLLSHKSVCEQEKNP
jgi:hypothetical protein